MNYSNIFIYLFKKNVQQFWLKTPVVSLKSFYFLKCLSKLLSTCIQKLALVFSKFWNFLIRMCFWYISIPLKKIYIYIDAINGSRARISMSKQTNLCRDLRLFVIYYLYIYLIMEVPTCLLTWAYQVH